MFIAVFFSVALCSANLAMEYSDTVQCTAQEMLANGVVLEFLCEKKSVDLPSYSRDFYHSLQEFGRLSISTNSARHKFLTACSKEISYIRTIKTLSMLNKRFYALLNEKTTFVIAQRIQKTYDSINTCFIQDDFTSALMSYFLTNCFPMSTWRPALAQLMLYVDNKVILQFFTHVSIKKHQNSLQANMRSGIYYQFGDHRLNLSECLLSKFFCQLDNTASPELPFCLCSGLFNHLFGCFLSRNIFYAHASKQKELLLKETIGCFISQIFNEQEKVTIMSHEPFSPAMMQNYNIIFDSFRPCTKNSDPQSAYFYTITKE